MNCNHGVPEEKHCEQCAYDPKMEMNTLHTELATVKDSLAEAVRAWEWNSKRLVEAERLLRGVADIRNCDIEILDNYGQGRCRGSHFEDSELRRLRDEAMTFLTPTQPSDKVKQEAQQCNFVCPHSSFELLECSLAKRHSGPHKWTSNLKATPLNDKAEPTFKPGERLNPRFDKRFAEKSQPSDEVEPTLCTCKSNTRVDTLCPKHGTKSISGNECPLCTWHSEGTERIMKEHTALRTAQAAEIETLKAQNESMWSVVAKVATGRCCSGGSTDMMGSVVFLNTQRRAQEIIDNYPPSEAQTKLATVKVRLAEAEGYLSSLIDDNELEIISHTSRNCGRDYYFCSICGEQSETKTLLKHEESCIYPKIIAFIAANQGQGTVYKSKTRFIIN